jgi:hypothetical protein
VDLLDALRDLLAGHHEASQQTLQSLHRKVDQLMSSTDTVLVGLQGLQSDLANISTDIAAGIDALASLEAKLAGTPVAANVQPELDAIGALHASMADLHDKLAGAVATAHGPGTGTPSAPPGSPAAPGTPVGTTSPVTADPGVSSTPTGTPVAPGVATTPVTPTDAGTAVTGTPAAPGTVAAPEAPPIVPPLAGTGGPGSSPA